ncbi:MAG: YggT family protein [Paenibacillus sp.]|uniref:YggT family protein n=1 Tax=Paenibacillus aquistagni TaxID=1852522 RepID=A0A1X7IFM4_9BACL|nr:YggT family protein [Paenibacillus aquistagni]MBR2568291.1 YggT family protein [Paenibacillus sp.]NMM51446.1 YggT family protein [Paenibacillus aquistagni]SMG13579.1 YggT family protein [Paenibacillus aquistagni]
MLQSQIVTYLNYLFQIYWWMIIIYVLMSWIPNVRASFIGEFLGKLVEPYLSIFRRFIPPIGGMLDISPIVALFVLNFVQLGLITVVQTIIG